MNSSSLLTMAVEGLFRKKARNALTMLGIVIAVLSLALVISAGEGMNTFIDRELKQEQNMLQVVVHPGFGTDVGDIFAEVRVEGEMSDVKRNRIRRAVTNRRGPQHMDGRRTKLITDEELKEIAEIDHVTSVQPLIHERYDVRCGDRESKAVLSLAVSPESRRYEKRLIAGRWFSDTNAREVIVHEHLLYTWRIFSDAEQATWVGKEIRIEPIQGRGLLDSLQGFVGGQGLHFDPERMLEANGIELEDEEKDALRGLAVKFFTGVTNSTEEAATRPAHRFEIVGVIRDFEPKDGNLHLVEDGAALVSDMLLPLGTSRSIFLESPHNRDRGYARALVAVDSPEYAKAVQRKLQKRGFIAIPIGVLLDKMDSVLTGLAVFQTFIMSVILVVAGLGIMTTMITSVVERTREIGIWKAVGATNGQVLLVFQTESAIVGFAGSVLGLVAARLLMIPGNMLGRYIIEQKTTFLIAGDVFVLPVWVIVVAPLFATFIGVAASIYPARRAARIDPVSALRHD